MPIEERQLDCCLESAAGREPIRSSFSRISKRATIQGSGGETLMYQGIASFLMIKLIPATNESLRTGRVSHKLGRIFRSSWWIGR